MSGVESNDDVTTQQLEALAGGELLKSEVNGYSNLFFHFSFCWTMQIKGLPIILIFHDFYQNWSLTFSLGFCMKFRDSCLELQNI